MGGTCEGSDADQQRRRASRFASQVLVLPQIENYKAVSKGQLEPLGKPACVMLSVRLIIERRCRSRSGSCCDGMIDLRDAATGLACARIASHRL